MHPLNSYIRLPAWDQYTALLVVDHLLNSSKEHNEKASYCALSIREVLQLPLHCNVTECDKKLYLLLGQRYRWNTLILHFVYIAHNLFKGPLIGLTVYPLDL